MSFIARLQRAREILEQQGRLSTRALERELEIGGDELDELIEELVDVQQVARREGKILVWAAATERADTPRPVPACAPTRPPLHSPRTRPIRPRRARSSRSSSPISSARRRCTSASMPESVTPLDGALLPGDARRRRSPRRHGRQAAGRRGHGRLRRAARRRGRCHPRRARRRRHAGRLPRAGAQGVRGRGRHRPARRRSTPARSSSAPTTPTSSAIRSTSPRACSRRRTTAKW